MPDSVQFNHVQITDLLKDPCPWLDHVTIIISRNSSIFLVCSNHSSYPSPQTGK